MDQRTTSSLPDRNFDPRTDGLFATNDQGKETRICDAIWHIGNAARADGSDAADIVKFLDCTGSSKEIVLPRRDSAVNTTRMFEKLANYNFDVPQSKGSRNQLVSYLVECRRSPERSFLLVHRMGWHGDSFVIGKDVIAADATVGVRLDGSLSREVEKFGQGGKLVDYQEEVLRRTKYSSRLMTGVALALLAPLARIIGIENGGINIVGEKGFGKTTVLRVIGSFWGGGEAQYFKTWAMTDNAPETLGLTHCDLPLLLDELDTLDADPRTAADRLKTIVHRLCAGQEKTRSHHAPLDGGPANDFHVIFASSAEQRVADFMDAGDRKVTGGLAARFVDVPADAGRGLKIFERLPRSRSGKRIDPDRYLGRLNRACKPYFGAAGRAYLRYLVQEMRTNPDDLKAFMRKQMAAFEIKVANDPQVDPRIRRRFAALYAAGQLGLRSEILPPECDGFMDAIGACYRDAVALMPRSALSAVEAINTLRKFLDDNRKGLLKVDGEKTLTGKAYRDAVGLRRTSSRHGKCVWLKRDSFHEIFPDNHGSAAKLLAAAGVIVRSSAGIARQERVPGLGTKEYYYIIDPAKLDADPQKMEDREKPAPRH
jgi:putative DNA primase/helicase